MKGTAILLFLFYLKNKNILSGSVANCKLTRARIHQIDFGKRGKIKRNFEWEGIFFEYYLCGKRPLFILIKKYVFGSADILRLTIKEL